MVISSPASLITIVNIYKHKPTPADYKIHRPSPLGNPFTHIKGKSLAQFQVETRDEACEKGEEYLRKKVAEKDPAVLKAFAQIKEMERIHGNVNLVCFCAPLRCHGEGIIKMIEEGIV